MKRDRWFDLLLIVGSLALVLMAYKNIITYSELFETLNRRMM